MLWYTPGMGLVWTPQNAFSDSHQTDCAGQDDVTSRRPISLKELHRKQRTSDKPRARRPNTKEQVVVDKQYLNKRLEKEFVAEFDYSPGKCKHTYRMVVLRKQISVTKGEQKLFDDSPYFFYITNITAAELTVEEIVGESNQRCDQENIISQLKQLGALSAPLHTLTSNLAYMVMATLAWNLNAWLAISLTESGPPKAKAKRRAETAVVNLNRTSDEAEVRMLPYPPDTALLRNTNTNA